MYIVDQYAISPQKTFDNSFQEGEVIEIISDKYFAVEPNYMELIPRGLLRRMGKAVRMGIGAALPLIQRNPQMDGIIIGTANGGLEDCIKFLNQIVDYDEGVLTPTNFVQSTPNALAGQLALMTKNSGYNSTHVNGSLAFENAILDAKLYLDNKPEDTSILVGGVEEISTYNYNIDIQNKRYKSKEISNLKLLEDKDLGTVCGEGATMFVLSNSGENSICEIIDTAQTSSSKKSDIKNALINCLNRNNLKLSDIDWFVAGDNGDPRFDHYYESMTEQLPNLKDKFTYKEFIGDYRTASAFACFFTSEICKGQVCFTDSQKLVKKGDVFLLYNQFEGDRHGFILIKK